MLNSRESGNSFLICRGRAMGAVSLSLEGLFLNYDLPLPAAGLTFLA
jgi:hypothetical protein